MISLNTSSGMLHIFLVVYGDVFERPCCANFHVVSGHLRCS